MRDQEFRGSLLTDSVPGEVLGLGGAFLPQPYRKDNISRHLQKLALPVLEYRFHEVTTLKISRQCNWVSSVLVLVTSTKVGELAEGKPVTIGADDSIRETLDTMARHKVRRLPVIDGHDLVGVISQADTAANLDDEDTGQLVEVISASS